MTRLFAVLLATVFASHTIAAELVLRVNNVKVTVLKAGLKIRAEGVTSSNGWKNFHLKQAPSTGGTLAFEFVGDPPSGISNPVISPATATTTWKGDFTTISRVVVTAKTNSIAVAVKHPDKGGKSLVSASVRSKQGKAATSVTVTCTCGTKSTTASCPNDKNNTCDCSDPNHPKVICGS